MLGMRSPHPLRPWLRSWTILPHPRRSLCLSSTLSMSWQRWDWWEVPNMISMINPHHVCSWTGRRLTEIKVTGVAATGAGVSLHVLLHAFGGQELVWFSRVYGDHDDNFLLLAVDRAAAGSLQRLPPHRPMPETVASDNPAVEEFALSEAVAARLEVRIEDAGCSVGRRDLIRKEIYIHDDCFFSV